MKPLHIDIKEYSYDLPDDRIAKFPLEHRSDSKLLVYNKGKITHHQFVQLAEFIQPNTLIIFNNTCVIEARLLFRKSSGSEIEIFILQPATMKNAEEELKSKGISTWKCMIGNKKRWKEKDELILNSNNVQLKAKWINRENDVIQFEYDPNFSFEQILSTIGKLPIPPYLNRHTTEIDLTRYQTVFAKHKGSVAAPTAALHFDESIYHSLKEKNVDVDYLTLHVGAGTFKPVTDENAVNHPMHGEYIIFTKSLIKKMLEHKHQLISVGTTSFRSLESLYWFGVGLITGKLTEFIIPQYFPYETNNEIPADQSLNAVIDWMEMKKLDTLEGISSIYIIPGYNARVANAIITNFHQPQSTLLLLIAALVGNDWKTIYKEAMNHEYRFLSYGDSSLLFF